MPLSMGPLFLQAMTVSLSCLGPVLSKGQTWTISYIRLGFLANSNL